MEVLVPSRFRSLCIYEDAYPDNDHHEASKSPHDSLSSPSTDECVVESPILCSLRAVKGMSHLPNQLNDDAHHEKQGESLVLHICAAYMLLVCVHVHVQAPVTTHRQDGQASK